MNWYFYFSIIYSLFSTIMLVYWEMKIAVGVFFFFFFAKKSHFKFLSTLWNDKCILLVHLKVISIFSPVKMEITFASFHKTFSNKFLWTFPNDCLFFFFFSLNFNLFIVASFCYRKFFPVANKVSWSGYICKLFIGTEELLRIFIWFQIIKI